MRGPATPRCCCCQRRGHHPLSSAPEQGTTRARQALVAAVAVSAVQDVLPPHSANQRARPVQATRHRASMQQPWHAHKKTIVHRNLISRWESRNWGTQTPAMRRATSESCIIHTSHKVQPSGRRRCEWSKWSRRAPPPPPKENLTPPLPATLLESNGHACPPSPPPRLRARGFASPVLPTTRESWEYAVYTLSSAPLSSGLCLCKHDAQRLVTCLRLTGQQGWLVITSHHHH